MLDEGRKRTSNFTMFVIAGFYAALRGENIVKLDMHRLRSHLGCTKKNKPPCVLLALLGRFKGEAGSRYHIIPIAWKINSGIEARK